MEPDLSKFNNRMFDQQYLKREQYSTAANLQARINLHQRFHTNSYPWQAWAYDMLALEPGLQVLEVGCGPGGLWADNAERIPERTTLVLGDLSLGMLRTATRNIAEAGRDFREAEIRFEGLTLDAQHIPFPAAYFDVVVANHMLYHAPNIEKAVAEFRRVVKPVGRLFCATNGWGHMRQINDLIAGWVQNAVPGHLHQVRRFSLENGQEILKANFSEVKTCIYEDHLHITEVQPVLDYIASQWDTPQHDRDNFFQVVHDHVVDQIEKYGYFLVNKSQGILVAFP